MKVEITGSPLLGEHTEEVLSELAIPRTASSSSTPPTPSNQTNTSYFLPKSLGGARNGAAIFLEVAY